MPFLLALSVALVLLLLALVFLALGSPPLYSQLSALVGIVIASVSGFIALYNLELVPSDAPERV
jgi:hypothetical protein